MTGYTIKGAMQIKLHRHNSINAKDVALSMFALWRTI